MFNVEWQLHVAYILAGEKIVGPSIVDHLTPIQLICDGQTNLMKCILFVWPLITSHHSSRYPHSPGRRSHYTIPVDMRRPDKFYEMYSIRLAVKTRAHTSRAKSGDFNNNTWKWKKMQLSKRRATMAWILLEGSTTHFNSADANCHPLSPPILLP